MTTRGCHMSGYSYRFRSAILAASAFVLIRATAHAQSNGIGRPQPERVVATTVVGMYMPFGWLVANDAVAMRQIPALLVSARLGVRLTQHTGVDAGAAWTPSMVARSDWQRTSDHDGWVRFASVRTPLTFQSAHADASSFYLAPGIGLVKRSGEAWRRVKNTTSRAAVIGTGFRFRPHGSRVAYTGDLQDFISRIAYTDYIDRATPSRIHNDVLVSFGISLQLR
jgi:hypothetical protein